MGTRHADRIWMGSGATVIVLLVVAGWLLLISPKYAETNDVENQIADTQTQLITLRKRIGELQKDQANIVALRTALNKKKTALPDDSGVPAFLNQLQQSGTDTAVSVTGFTVGAPAPQTSVSGVWALPITLTVDGSMANLERFLSTLQTGQTRAVLIQSANVTPKSNTDGGGGSSGGGMSISLSLRAFVAPAAGAGTPAVKK